MCPSPRAPISSTRNRVSRVGPQHRVRVAQLVVERPGRRHRRAEPGSSCAIRSLVVVLPEEPVSPTTVSSGSRSSTARASRPIAVERVVDQHHRHARRPAGCPAPPPRRPRRPRRRSRGRRPSRRGTPRTARPGATLRESNSTAPVTTARRVGVDEPAADRGGDLGQGQRDHRGLLARPECGRTSPRVRSGARASSTRSSNGCTSPGDLLAALVPLAEQRDHVAGRGQPRPPRRSRPAGRPPPPTSACPGRSAPGEHLGPDRRRVLGARVVVGDDHQVGAARGRRAHQRPLAPVPVAAGADARRSAGRRAPASSRSAASAATIASGLCA